MCQTITGINKSWYRGGGYESRPEPIIFWLGFTWCDSRCRHSIQRIWESRRVYPKIPSPRWIYRQIRKYSNRCDPHLNGILNNLEDNQTVIAYCMWIIFSHHWKPHAEFVFLTGMPIILKLVCMKADVLWAFHEYNTSKRSVHSDLFW